MEATGVAKPSINGGEVSVLNRPEQQIGSRVVREELARQLGMHINRDYLALSHALKEVAGSGSSEVIFVHGQPNGKMRVEIALDENRVQYLNMLAGKEQEMIKASRLLSGKINPGPLHEQMSIGHRLIRKKLDRMRTKQMSSRLEDLHPTQDDAEAVIRSVLSDADQAGDPKTVIVRSGCKSHDTVDVFNSRGWGVRIRVISGMWFLQEISDSLHYVRPENCIK